MYKDIYKDSIGLSLSNTWWGSHLQSIRHQIFTGFCCTLFSCDYTLVHGGSELFINPYSSGLFHWHWDDPLTAQRVPVKEPWMFWETSTSTKPQQNTTKRIHYSDIIMGTMASQITSLTIVYSTANSSADQRKYQSSVSLAFVRGINRWPVNSPHKGPVTLKMFPFDDVIMMCRMLIMYC